MRCYLGCVSQICIGQTIEIVKRGCCHATFCSDDAIGSAVATAETLQRVVAHG